GGLACLGRGIAKGVVLACSVLPFHAIRIFSPMRCGGDGGAIKTGRPGSNKPASILVMLGLDRLLAPRLPHTMTSKTRPLLPTNGSPSGAASNQPNERAPSLLALATPFPVMNFSNTPRASFAISAS